VGAQIKKALKMGFFDSGKSLRDSPLKVDVGWFLSSVGFESSGKVENG